LFEQRIFSPEVELHRVWLNWLSGYEEVENVRIEGQTDNGQFAMTEAHLSFQLR
jgi:hypothetical protein